MAAISSGAIFVSYQPVTFELPNPPVENNSGESLFISDVFVLVGTTKKHFWINTDQAMMLSSVLVVSLAGVLIKSNGGGFMSYVPLYLAMIFPIYWIFKIFAAYFVSSLSHPKSMSYQVKDATGRYVSHHHTVTPGTTFLDATLKAFREREVKNGD